MRAVNAPRRRQLGFAAYCLECLFKRGIYKRGKADHQFNVVPVVFFWHNWFVVVVIHAASF